MNLFVVDPEKCVGDGRCVAECPANAIEIKDGESIPASMDGVEDHCFNCGHCVSVCPNGALSLKTMAVEECPPVRPEWDLSPEQVEHFLRSRRSIRTYKDRSVDRELLTKLIDIAHYVPSGHNWQPVRWLVIHDRNEVRRLTEMTVDFVRYVLSQPALAGAAQLSHSISGWDRGIDTISHGALHLIIAYAWKDYPASASECAQALAYLELAAPSLGLGSCQLGLVQAAAASWPPMQQALGLPEGHLPFGTVAVGYPAYDYHRLPLRNEAQVVWH